MNSKEIYKKAYDIEKIIRALHYALVTEEKNVWISMPCTNIQVRPDGKEVQCFVLLGVAESK